MLFQSLSETTDEEASSMAGLASAVGRYVETGEGRDELAGLIQAVVSRGGS